MAKFGKMMMADDCDYVLPVSKFRSLGDKWYDWFVDNEMVRRLHGDEMCVINKPIFNDTEIPIPMCEETYPAKVLVGEMCNVNEISVCGDHMTCVQVNKANY